MTFIVSVGPSIEVVAQTDPRQAPASYQCVLGGLQAGWSRQHLARRFGDEFGLGPKLAARVVRLARARQMLLATPSFVTIAQVAAACGYYDQAHLSRDFAELAGCTPTAWLAEELPSFQDEAMAGM